MPQQSFGTRTPAEKSEARGLHLRFALQPLDGSIGGASYREIAEALIGEPRVQADFIAIICVTASAAPFGAAVCS
ncbi:DUF2285 domain-containing protein [Mesorhizobium sp. M0816]|uniref:DNA -binding domain-containing protein n=1 Tax=Mesorhizobium sp. M0816 TaxID=2957006 RepID=UPI00333AEB97